MTLQAADAAIRIGGVAILLLLGSLLIGHRRAVGAPAMLFAPLSLCLSGFLLGNTSDDALHLAGSPAAAAHLASGFTVVFLWWFSLGCFDRDFRPRGAILATGLLWAALASADRGLLGPALADLGLSALLVPLGFGIVGHLVWRLAADHRGDFNVRRRDARVTVSVVLGGLLLVDLAADAAFGLAWRPPAFAMTQNIAISGFGLWFASRILSVRADVIAFAEPPRAPASAVSDPLHRRLAVLMEEEQLFLDPDMNLATFVRAMGSSERNVRRLINHDLGFDHFRTFLNHHRLGEARRLLADPARSGDKLIAVALDSGFASLPSFNRVFRAAEGCSPGEYRARTLAGTPFEQRCAGFREAASVRSA